MKTARVMIFVENINYYYKLNIKKYEDIILLRNYKEMDSLDQWVHCTPCHS